eukprot:TRINITY_DN1833_c4_g1_i1.p1 TRINITY_DN1833_c4_g1~~TRINITY_DN1833_c4_g1_i1.p1  ORF type:complete len:1343 (+),score=266.81 TRINITY_DN1833_c4_g1_i1:30-4031(+)
MLAVLVYTIMAVTPTLLGRTDAIGAVADVKIMEKMLYAVTGFTGLVILDLSPDPKVPQEVGRLKDGLNEVVSVDAVNIGSVRVAIVGDRYKGLVTVDVTNPSSPVILGMYTITASEVTHVRANGANIVYLANGAAGVHAIDIATPSTPVLLGTYPSSDFSRGACVVGTTIYISDTSAVYIADFSTPGAPRSLGSITVASRRPVFLVRSSCYIPMEGLASESVRIYDITDPRNPVLSATHPGSGYGVFAVGSTLYIAKGVTGVEVVDITTPTSPALLGSVATPGNAMALVVTGGYAFVASMYGGVQIVDLSVTATPVVAGSFDFYGGDSHEVYVTPNYIFVTGKETGLQVISGPPSMPSVVASSGVGVPGALYADGSDAHTSDDLGRYLVTGYSNPALPVSKGVVRTASPPTGIYGTSGVSYVTIGTGGLDILDTASYSKLGNINLGITATSVFVVGTTAYVTGGDKLMAVSVRTPATPTPMGTVTITGTAEKVHVVGTTAYIACAQGGLTVADVSAFNIIGSYVPSTDPNYVDVHYCACTPTFIYAIDRTIGLVILDISTPASPVLEGTYQTYGDARGLYVQNNVVYVADVGLWTLSVFDTTAPDTPAPDTPAPDTSAPDTSVPDTLAPDTSAPDSPAPNTLAPDTSEPNTLVPNTRVPSTAAPVTLAPDTAAPSTPSPRLPGKGVTQLSFKGTRELQSLNIQEEGERTGWHLKGGAALRCKECFVQVEVRWPGGRAVSTPPGAMQCSGAPCVIVETDRSVEMSKSGLASTVQRSSAAVLGQVVATDEEITQSLNRSDTLMLSVADKEFRAYAPLSEALTMRLSKDMFDDEVWQELCSMPARVSQGLVCSCEDGSCVANYTLKSQPPSLPNEKELEVMSVTGTGAILAVSAVLPVSATAGGAMMRMSLLTKGMYCPSDGPTKMDRLVNPLQLKFGDDPLVEEVNGAVVGSIISQCVLLGIGGLGMLYMYHKVKREKGELMMGVQPQMRRMERDGLTATYIGARSHFGWLLIPFVFVYGGAVMCCSAALLYSSMGFKVLGGANLAVFGIGLPAYALWVARTARGHAYVQSTGQARSKFKWFFWGTEEWAVLAGFLDESWQELHKLVYDGYKGFLRAFLFKELAFTCLLAMIEAFEPSTPQQCTVKGVVVCCLLGTFLLALLLLRPYLAPYESVFEASIVMVELAMSILVVMALRQDRPTEHLTALWAGNLGILALNMIVVKFLLDLAIFLYDEREVWMGKGAKGAFLTHLLCCGSRLNHDDEEWAAGEADENLSRSPLAKSANRLVPPSFSMSENFLTLSQSQDDDSSMYPLSPCFNKYCPPYQPRYGIAWGTE